MVTAADASAAEKTAATELQSHLREATGAELPVYTEAETPADAKQILVGPGARLK